MINQDSRWQQRFDNYSKAYLLLYGALENKEIEDFDDLQKEGLIQRFEYTFELLWKTIKDYLQYQSVEIEIISPKKVFRAAAGSNLLEHMDIEGDVLLEMLEKRNLMSHTYDIATFSETLTLVKDVYLPQFTKVFHYFNIKREESNG